MQYLTSDTAFDWPQLELNRVGWCLVTSVLCALWSCVCSLCCSFHCPPLINRKAVSAFEGLFWKHFVANRHELHTSCLHHSVMPYFFFLISLHQYCPPLNYARFWLPFWCSKQHCWWYTVAPASGKAGMGLRGCCVNVNLICDLPVWWLFHLQYAYTLFRVNLKLKQ